MFRVLLAVALISMASSGTPADAQAPTASVDQEAPLPRVRQRAATETTLISEHGLEYRVLVSAPRGPAPEGGFPVFYVLDGDAFFSTANKILPSEIVPRAPYYWNKLNVSLILWIFFYI